MCPAIGKSGSCLTSWLESELFKETETGRRCSKLWIYEVYTLHILYVQCAQVN
jgi:hypothetical protein